MYIVQYLKCLEFLSYKYKLVGVSKEKKKWRTVAGFLSISTEGKDKTLPFFNTLLKREDNGTINITLYRKPTHTETDTWTNNHTNNHQKVMSDTCMSNFPSFSGGPPYPP